MYIHGKVRRIETPILSKVNGANPNVVLVDKVKSFRNDIRTEMNSSRTHNILSHSSSVKAEIKDTRHYSSTEVKDCLLRVAQEFGRIIEDIRRLRSTELTRQGIDLAKSKLRRRRRGWSIIAPRRNLSWREDLEY
ncbi:hypothetical protein VDGL01_10181 [Verticillium dahliae]